MKEVIRPRLKALSAMLILLLAAYFAFLIPSGTALELHDRDSDTRIASWPIQAGDELSLEIEHSFEHIPWYEFYTVTEDGQFDLDKIAVAGYGAGNTAVNYPAGYVVPGSPLLLYFQYALDTLHWTRGFTVTFNEVKSWGYVPLGEDAFLCQGMANFTTATRNETRENLVEYEMLWIRRNGTWYIQDMSFL